ncbi:hybrid sensor histidine kinase/response regulator [Novispirillum itersonii]|uniref:hybrid sensor histidine kinase/response regulator n=1 Tax=Novispirillum itersonii TaxID=189 RepID=UPI001FE094E5|nr:hybrid sensor histidine kinase/response regulator [Novispirillum itersonii]
MNWRLRVGLAMSIMGLLFVSALACFVLLLDRKTEAMGSVSEDMVWSTYQFDREVMKVELAMREAAADPSEAHMEALRLNVDILISRLMILREGQMVKLLAEAGLYPQLIDVVSRADRIVAEFDSIDQDGKLADRTLYLAGLLKRLRNDTSEITALANQARADHISDSRAQDVRIYLIMGGLVAAMMVAMLGVSWLLFRQIREIENSRTNLTLLSDKLRDAAARAEAGSRAKSEFLATMSHEIRTPMNGVIGMTDLLLEGQLDARQRHRALTIRKSAEHLLDLINDILDFSKLEANRVILQESDFSLTDLVESVPEMLVARAAEKDLELVVTLYPEVCRDVRGDASRLRQVLVNLVGNAIKFTDYGGIEVVVRPGESDIDRIRFEVIDTGIGIPEEEQIRLFQLFTQIDGSDTRTRGGTGLGLAISKRIVDCMGGRIGVSSTPGSGSVFWFEVPLPPTGAIHQMVPPQLRGRSVALVSPRDFLGRTLHHQLRVMGFSVDLMNTDAAAQLSYGGQHDLLITDGLLLLPPALQSLPWLTLPEAGAEAEALKRVAQQQGRVVLVRPLTPRHVLRALSEVMGLEPIELDELPRVRAPAAALSAPAAAQPAAPRVLVAEDNPVNQQVIAGFLELVGCDLEIVGNGTEAVAAVRRGPFDVVLMDVQMPGMDGLEATRRIRALGGHGMTVPIVALTANAMPGDERRCLEAGMNGYVAKPVDRVRLSAALRPYIPLRGDLPAPGSVGDLINLSQLGGLVETLGETAVDRLLQTFTKDSLMRVRAMRLSWTQGGAQGGGDHVRAELHSIVGAAVGIGMKRVTLLCEQIRDAVIANVGSEVERLLDLLEAVLNALPVTWKAINDAVASAETVLPPSSSSSGDRNGQVIPLRKPGA